MPRPGPVTHEAVERAMRHVLGELGALWLLTQRLYDVEVHSQPRLRRRYQGVYQEEPGLWKRLWGYRDRNIYIPRAKVWSFSLRDVLRHEYAHAFAVEHPSLVRRSRAFEDVFGGEYDLGKPVGDHDRDAFVSEYAATEPAEDFAETWMVFVRGRGEIERYRHRRGVFRKLRFVGGLARTVRRRGWAVEP